MAIRFQCSFCTQPIEVDDEWASRSVACPYCRKTITAPAESTLQELVGVPTATPLGGAEETVVSRQPTAVSPQPFPPGQYAEFTVAGPNRVALVALGLAGGMFVFAICLLSILGAHGEELATFAKPGASFSEQMQALTEVAEAEDGRFPPWLVAMSLLEIGVLMLWIATVVCGVMGVRHPRRRRFAIAALVLAGITPILLCGGTGAIFAPYA